MIKTITEAIFDGYGSGETDFLVRFRNSDVQVLGDIETNILIPILDVLSSPNKCAVLTVTGHSDRVDTEGLTREQRRQQEFAASETRANSAADGVWQLIRDTLSGGAPANFDELSQLAILVRAAGAAVLKESAERLSEEQRKRNRRVQFRVVRFQPN